ncbi:MAG: hypothetical protein QOE96_915 [Blastocatellia bacterium]|jgi:pyruvate-formate lyase-activating enzyme|nr:hypothetical protein [Blastocatellia bacterium]
MIASNKFNVVLIKPSKYSRTGHVERFRRGFMPNSTLLHLKSLTPAEISGRQITVVTVDEYTQTDLDYLELLRPETCSLFALVGVQSHQIQRALDLAALARTNGVRNCVIGGPHVMTCDTSEVHGLGVSFALAEAELIWPAIIRDAFEAELHPVYGSDRRWQSNLEPPAMVPPSPADLRPYIIPMVGIYPARGCPYNCNFCSVVKIAGKKVRSQPVETTVRSLIAAREAGVRLVVFASDNFNKYPEAQALLEAMIDAHVGLPFFVQCDAQVGRDEAFIKLLARAGCAQVFVGVESFNRKLLSGARKHHNDPGHYADLVRLCHQNHVSTHFSNIFGFPEQEEADVLHHLRELRALRPFMASFYILAPIPGTDQYDDFLAHDLITETNLDRFDATCLIWKHPVFSERKLSELLCRAYREFYGTQDVLLKMFGYRWNAPWYVHALGIGYAAFARFAVRRGMHPMAGGFLPVAIDKVEDYLPLRRRVFGIDRLQLPQSLKVSNATDRLLYQDLDALPSRDLAGAHAP